MCFESVCGSFAVGFFCLYWIEEEWQTWWYAPQKNERHRNCMWRHFLYSQYFQVMVNYPCGNDHISHRSTCYTGTLESMIFRTSQLVGYVSSVPWRAWRVWYMHSEQWRCGESPRKIHWINWFFELDYFSATTWSRKIINISTCSKGGAYSKEWHSQKTRYKYIHISQSFPICYSCCCERSTFWWFFWGGILLDPWSFCTCIFRMLPCPTRKRLRWRHGGCRTGEWMVPNGGSGRSRTLGLLRKMMGWFR